MMQNVSQQPHVPSEDERGYYAPVPPPEYQGSENERGYAPVPPSEYQESVGPQGSSQQPLYAPEQPYVPYYQGQQQQSWNQQAYGQWAPGDIGPFEGTAMGMKARTAGLLCYLFGWVGGLVFFLLERDSRFVRFHAVQSILFFGTVSILGWVCSFFPYALVGLGGVVGLIGFIGWIVLMVAAHRGRYYKLPVFGDLAEQLMSRITL